MKVTNLFIPIFSVIAICIFYMNAMASDVPALKAPVTKVGMSVEEALRLRASTKAFSPGKVVGLEKISQILWAADGLNRVKEGKRTHPSPMAKYTVSVYLTNGKGTFRYNPEKHKLEKINPPKGWKADPRKVIPAKEYVEDAPQLLMLVGDVTKLPSTFDESLRWNWIYCEAGTIAQNVHLQAAALGLGTCVIAGFNGNLATELLQLSKGQQVMFLMPLGYKK